MKTNTINKHFNIDFLDKKIRGSKRSFNKAGKGEKEYYDELTDKMAKHPDFELEVVEQKQHITGAKRTYHGLNCDFIEAYLKTRPNAAELKKQYDGIVITAEKAEMAKYPLVKKWFLKMFNSEEKPFNMDEARKEISDYHLRIATETLNEDSENTDKVA